MNTLISEMTDQGEILYDVFSKLVDERIIFISDYITDRIATDVCATILYLDQKEDSKISLYLNVEGGDIRSVMMIYDIMNLVKSPIQTLCIGSAFDEALLLLSAGTKGMRFSTKSSKFCLSNIATYGPRHADMASAKIIIDQIKKDNHNFLSAISKTTGMKLTKISADAATKMFMSPAQAKKYGLIDHVIGSNK